MRNMRRMGLAAVAVLAGQAALAGRVETLLDGDMWTLDGVPVTVPHTWNAVDAADGRTDKLTPTQFAGYFVGDSVAGFAYQRKLATYGRALPDPKPGRRYFLDFDGVSQRAAVRVNGRLVARHVGAFTPFKCEITRHLKPTDNWLEVDADNRFDPDVPPVNADFSLLGGLYRHVTLVETPQVCIDPTRPIRLWPDAKTGKVRAEIPVSGAPDEVREYAVENHRLWSPEEPNLYPIVIRVGEDEVVKKVGFKTQEFRKDGFYLNGKKRFVQAVNRHQDVKGHGWAMPDEQVLADFRLIKAMGCDGVRLAHYPQSERVYEVCDELGIMVWSEVPIVNVLTMSENFLVNARTAAREMIVWRGNHACVTWWSVYNEVYNGAFNASRGQKPADGLFEPALRIVAADMRALDPTRPLVGASCQSKRTDMHAITDAMGMNIYPNWYVPTTMEKSINSFFRQNPSDMLWSVAEYGGGGSPFQHANPIPDWLDTAGPFHPEEYHTRLHMRDWRDINRLRDRLWGAFPWQMFDSPSDDRCEGFERGHNDKGLVCRDHKTLKDAYYLYQANWSKTPMLHLCSKRMGSTTNAVMDVVAFTNLKAPVRLLVNGKPAGERMPDDIASTVFPSVGLAAGENELKVVCGDLKDEMKLSYVK